MINPDGSYTIIVGPTDPSGAASYINDTGYSGLFVRDTVGDWALGPGTLIIQYTADCPEATAGVTNTSLSSADISNILAAAQNDTAEGNAFWMYANSLFAGHAPANQFTQIAMSGVNYGGASGGVPTQANAFGSFDLQPGQALIVKVPDIDANYSGIELENKFGQTLGYTLEQSSLNNTQVFSDQDGFTYYVISSTNPGVANWLDTHGLENGEVFVRWQQLTSAEAPSGTGITTQVVPVADVSQYLPSDTPTVSPAEYAADMTSRVLSYDYDLDASRTSDWVTQELYLSDLQQAMGTSNFDAVFGTEAATPMWLRLTPALSPEWNTVANDLLTNPNGSVTAIENNLALAENDIALPTQLAQTLLDQDFTQTASTVESHLSSGDLSGALSALNSGVQELGSIANGAFLDPNTSITAGLLNARDDLTTAIITANGGFPNQADPLATLEWNYLPELAPMTPTTMASDLSSMLSTATSDLSSLLHPADLTDASSLLGGLATDFATVLSNVIP